MTTRRDRRPQTAATAPKVVTQNVLSDPAAEYLTPSSVRSAIVRIADYQPHPRNYNGHPARQIEAIAASLRKFGQPRPVAVWRGYYLAGHGVVAAARSIGWTTIRADVLPDDYPEHLALAYVVADNELARLSDPDEAALFAIMQESRERDPELLQAMGYTEDEFEELYRTGAAERPQVEDFPTADLLSPYPYFGGKRAIAGAVWARFGEVDNYVEPFFGSGAMLLSRPVVRGIETVNDLDGFIANFWRAVAADPDAVARHVDWPVNENDLFARHLWLVGQRQQTTERLHADPEWYDAKIAGWWCWGACNWIGGGWCAGDGPWTVQEGEIARNAGQGVNRQLPHVGNAGRGVNRQLPHVGDAGRGVNRKLPEGDPIDDQCAVWAAHLAQMMGRLSDRLRRVRVACGDWQRVCSSSVTDRHGLTAVFLDPPYAIGNMEYSAGGNSDASLTNAVRDWCIENGDNPLMRIAFCGYEPLTMPAGWRALRWVARKGYQNEENANREREIIWFSPYCLEPDRHE